MVCDVNCCSLTYLHCANAASIAGSGDCTSRTLTLNRTLTKHSNHKLQWNSTAHEWKEMMTNCNSSAGCSSAVSLSACKNKTLHQHSWYWRLRNRFHHCLVFPQHTISHSKHIAMHALRANWGDVKMEIYYLLEEKLQREPLSTLELFDFQMKYTRVQVSNDEIEAHKLTHILRMRRGSESKCLGSVR